MTRLECWSPADLDRRRGQVLDVYAEAMGVPRSAARGRESILRGHLGRAGLRAVAAVSDEDRLVGVGYGYRGEPGQWWHDQVSRALSAEQVQHWLTGAFEVCELHVRPGHQGQGLGRRLLDRLLAGTGAATAVLTTPEGPTRARGFYTAGGWVELASRVRFPGDGREFAVLGRRVDPHA